MTQAYHDLLLTMPDQGGYGATAILLIIAVLFLVKQSTTKNLKEDYERALKSGDKQKALEAGRRYYRNFRRKGRLTIYDEQAIANDLNAMK